MNGVSITDEFLLNDQLAAVFAAEGLSPPSVMAWPLEPAAEQRRRAREDAFERTSADGLPPGLEWMRSHSAVKYRPDLVLEGCRAVLVSALGYYRHDRIDGPLPDDHAADLAAGSGIVGRTVNGAGPSGAAATNREIGAPRRPGHTSGTPEPIAGTDSPPHRRGRIARYARGRDYHREFGNRLRRIARALEAALPGHRFRSFVDIGPLDEVWLAEESGLGFIGRHTLAILPGTGSWAVLGHILTTYPFESRPGRPSPLSCPDGCRRCIDACPTGALIPPGRMDAARCISYFTIEHEGVVDAGLAAAAGDRVFGCDACQEACPFNRRVTATTVSGFLKDAAGPSIDLVDLLELAGREEMVRRFAGSPLLRAGRRGLVRNACIAAANSGEIGLLSALQALSGDPDQVVAQQARDAAAELLNRNPVERSGVNRSGRTPD